MKLILENWRHYLSEDEVIDDNQDSVIFEISFKKAAERLGAKTLTKFVKRHLWDEETGTIDYSPNEIAKIVWNLGQMLVSLVPLDLEDNQRGTILEWLISKGINDPQHSEHFVRANDTNDSRWKKLNLRSAEWLGANIPFWKSQFERFYHYQDFMKEKDLFAFDTFEEFQNVIDEANEKIEAYQSKQTNLDADKGTEIFRDDDQWKIYALHNKGAACHFGKGTHWCTAAPGLDYFNEYYKPDDPLFYFQLSKEANLFKHFKPGGRFQVHFGSEQYMDEWDHPLSEEQEYELLKLLMQTDAPKKYPMIREYNDVLISQIETDPEKLDKLARQAIARANDESLSLEERQGGGTFTVLHNIATSLNASHETLKMMLEELKDSPPESLPLPPEYIAERDDLTPELFTILAKKNKSKINHLLLANPTTPPEILNLIGERALEDPDAGTSDSYYVLLKLARNLKTSVKLLDKIASLESSTMMTDVFEERIRSSVAANPNTSEETLVGLFFEPASDIRYPPREVFKSLAKNVNTPFSILERIADEIYFEPLWALTNTAFKKYVHGGRKEDDKKKALELIDKVLDANKTSSGTFLTQELVKSAKYNKKRLHHDNHKYASAYDIRDYQSGDEDTFGDYHGISSGSPKRDLGARLDAMQDVMESWRRYRALCEQNSN